MSAGAPTLQPGRRTWTSLARRDPVAAGATQRPAVRLLTFAALAGYGMERWATLMRPAPGWRLVGLVLVAVAMAGVVPVLLRRSRLAGAVTALLLFLVTFPIAGLRWHWFIHLRIAVSADRIGNGLAELPNVLVPYLGTSHAVRLVIVLGGAVLLLDAAAVLGFSRGRSAMAAGAAAALPLTALAVVPGTLVRPEWPYLQGLLLFALLAGFLWGERVRRQTAASAIGIIAVAGVAGAIIAPRVDPGRPWVNYRAWTGTLVHQHVDTFNWNQTYGPLRWPRSGHEVFTVQAHNGDYWKAADLDTFNGYSWVAGSQSIQPALPGPDDASVKRWTQSLRVTILTMRTANVIAAGYAAEPSALAGGFGVGADAGTWVAGRTLGPGTTYQVSTYSPHPSDSQLATAGRAYPADSLNADLTLGIPITGGSAADVAQITFPLFHTHGQPSINTAGVAPAGFAARALARSPYAGAYALARGLAEHSETPYAFLAGVERYLARGFTYNENPPVRRYPLESFLLRDKQGYCQQFSGAMALLLRMGGIPARVASGFTSGSYNSSSHRWAVTDTDAHAWVEAWFPHYGWVRFDSTPRSAPARGGSTSSPITKGDAAKGNPNAKALRREFGNPGTTGTVSRSPSGGQLSPWLIVLAVALAGGVGWLAWRVWGRRSAPAIP